MKSLYLLLTGMVMGAADLVPGVSGGTIAFVFGIYEELIDSITRPIKCFPFLFKVISGIVLSMLLFSSIIKNLLADSYSETLLFASFFGFVLASIYFCVKKVKQWNFSYGVCFLIGAIAAYFLTGNTAISNKEASLGYVFFSGMVAVSAMLLPGISGSYLLVILGLYSQVIDAIVKLDFASMQLLAVLGLGILFGAVLFSRLIRYLLINFHDGTIALLIGFMVGALRAVNPFGQSQEVSVSLILITSVISFLVVLSLEWVASYNSEPRSKR